MNIKKILTVCQVILLLVGVAGAQAAGAYKADISKVSMDFYKDEAANQPRMFWYERTFGMTEVPYIVDTEHLYNPEGVGVDEAGNLWVAEPLGSRVLKYSGDGTFLMSIGTPGRAWLADKTRISQPMDVAVDEGGNIWVADQNAHRVVKYSPTGSYVTQLGVTWEGGSDDAHFANPWSIAFNSSGDIYVSDAGNFRIQVFTNGGIHKATIGMTGVAGSGNDHFRGQWRIAIDSDDNLYVADLGNERVQIFNSSNVYIATLGVTGVIGFDNSHFNNPRGVAVDTNRIYVVDGGNHRVQIFDRASRAYEDTLSIGGGSGDYQFDWPGDVAVDAAGNIYVADELNSRVQKYNSSLDYVSTFGVTKEPYQTDEHHFNMPSGVAVDPSGNIGIVEDGGRGHRFIQLNPSGEQQFTIGITGIKSGGEYGLANPIDVAYDASGNIFIVDQWNHRIQIYDNAGNYENTLGIGFGTGMTNFNFPQGVAVDANGRIYVADSGNHRIQIYNSDRNYVATLGVTGVSGDDNSHFYEPCDVSVDASGNIYIADTWNNRVQKFNSSFVYQMTLDGFWGPNGVAVDHLGNLYVADMWTNRVVAFSGNGNYLTTIGGSWGNQVDQFRHPTKVAVDAERNVYIADKDNHRVEKYKLGGLAFLPLLMRSAP
jgi:sugar lactone lactonase YvrE